VLPLVIGALLAALALTFVLAPVLRGSARHDQLAGGSPAETPADGQDEGAGAIEVLREIEFDRATGKLSETDYGALKSTYTARALAELRARDEAPQAGESLRPALARHACSACGASAPPDAVYCPRCARHLAGACPACGGAVTMIGARYCIWCGRGLGYKKTG
jgi:Double zinc ribbon